MHTTSMVSVVHPIVIIVWKWSIHYASLSAMFNLLPSKMNQELYVKHQCNHQSIHLDKNE